MAVHRLIMVAVFISGLLVACGQDLEKPEAPAPDFMSPPDMAVFPPDMAAPVFSWEFQPGSKGNATIAVEDANGKRLAGKTTTEERWIPSESEWRSVVAAGAGERRVRISLGEKSPESTIRIAISKDPVGASLFYREVNLPFIDAVKDPSKIQWRFGDISRRKKPKVVLTNLPVCGNCHSFSRDGKHLGMDVDYANDKGSFIIKETRKEIALDKASVISWNDYKKEDGEPTFGLLSQISPDGRYVVSTVKDRSVFVPMPDLAFSQLFFPVKGILAVYDRVTKTYKALPGADDPKYVQSNPSWSPDGKHIVFARSEAHELKVTGKKVLLKKEDCAEFTSGKEKFVFDLFRVPFNNGEGGAAEPLNGASEDGMSNYFAKYSPDGKWIVFCKSKSFMLLQADSELFIIPAEGGEARRLEANTSRMNSWHSWSPNSRWLVFSSKARGPYTKLFLTHIDEAGKSSAAIELDFVTSETMAANIPEFVDLPGDAIESITERFVDEVSFMRAGNEFSEGRDAAGAERAYKKALSINPNHLDTLANYGFLLMQTGRKPQAEQLLKRALELQPDSGEVVSNLSFLYIQAQRFPEARALLTAFLQEDPTHAEANNHMGFIVLQTGDPEGALKYFYTALEADEENPRTHCNLARVLTQLEKQTEAEPHWARCKM